MKDKLNRLSVYPVFICIFLLIACAAKKIIIEEDSMLSTIPLGSICEYKQQTSYRANDLVLVKYLNNKISKEMTNCFRIVGIPGDTVDIEQGTIFRNNKEFSFPVTAILNYDVKFAKAVDSTQPLPLGILSKSHLKDSYFSSESELTQLKNKGIINSFYRKPFDPADRHFVLEASFTKNWNMDFFGPIQIKKQGEDLVNDEHKFYYGTKSYDRQVNDDFYFVVADNFYQSFDSRTVGLIPKANILGKISNINTSTAWKEIKVE